MRHTHIGLVAIIVSLIISLSIGYYMIESVQSIMKPSGAIHAHCITLEDCGTDSECKLIEEMLARK